MHRHTRLGWKLLLVTAVAALLIPVVLRSGEKDHGEAAAAGLAVNASNSVNPFSSQMLGQAFVNWEHAWGKPFPSEVPNLAQALEQAGVGLIRYAGGLWANDVGFDRTTQRTPYEEWTKNGNTYWFHYGTDELASLNELADSVGAEVMVQVNISTYDPQMWADMVRYVNLEQGYGFKYWELGNEFDHATDKNVSPETYATRMKAYIDAMKAVDPSIEIISGVPAHAHDGPRLGWSDSVTAMSEYLTQSAAAVTPAGRKTDHLSYHWYQACNSSSSGDILRWTWDGLNEDSWRNSYSRKWSQIVPVRVDNEVISDHGSMRQGISELNFDSCDYDSVLNGNHLNALWASDVIGRLAYHGLDFATWYEGYANQGFSVLYADSSDNPTTLFARPSYYAFFMYNKYFGDQLVESNSYNDAEVSIWASTDSLDPGKLKLRITNMTGSDLTLPTNISGFSASSASVYVLSSTNPTDMSSSSNTSAASTSINGVTFDVNDVADSAGDIEPVDLHVSGSTFTYTYPAFSSVAIVLDSGATPAPTPTDTAAEPSPTPTTTPSATPPSQPTFTPTRASVDTTPPSVSIINPADKSAVRRKSTVQIEAGVKDDIGVQRVEFLVDGRLICQLLSSGPFVCPWQLNGRPNATYTVTVRAIDEAGNSAEAIINVRSGN